MRRRQDYPGSAGKFSSPLGLRPCLVDQAAEFAFLGELLRFGGGFVEQDDGLAEGGGAFLAAGGVVRLRQRRGVVVTREIPTHLKAVIAGQTQLLLAIPVRTGRSAPLLHRHLPLQLLEPVDHDPDLLVLRH